MHNRKGSHADVEVFEDELKQMQAMELVIVSFSYLFICHFCFSKEMIIWYDEPIFLRTQIGMLPLDYCHDLLTFDLCIFYSNHLIFPDGLRIFQKVKTLTVNYHKHLLLRDSQEGTATDPATRTSIAWIY